MKLRENPYKNDCVELEKSVYFIRVSSHITSNTIEINSLSESPWHLLLWQIYRHMHTNLINVRATYPS